MRKPHQPVPYLESLPDDLTELPVMVLDPMVATGGSMTHTVGLLLRRGATDITVLCVVAAPEGLAALEKVAPNARLFTAAVDDGLNEIAYHCARSRRCGRPPVRAALASSPALRPRRPVRRAARRPVPGQTRRSPATAQRTSK